MPLPSLSLVLLRYSCVFCIPPLFAMTIVSSLVLLRLDVAWVRFSLARANGNLRKVFCFSSKNIYAPKRLDVAENIRSVFLKVSSVNNLSALSHLKHFITNAASSNPFHMIYDREKIAIRIFHRWVQPFR